MNGPAAGTTGADSPSLFWKVMLRACAACSTVRTHRDMHIEDSQVLGPAHRRNSLRGATDHLHRDLDRLSAGFNLGDVTHYRRFLQANAATLIAIEQLLENAG